MFLSCQMLKKKKKVSGRFPPRTKRLVDIISVTVCDAILTFSLFRSLRSFFYKSVVCCLKGSSFLKKKEMCKCCLNHVCFQSRIYNRDKSSRVAPLRMSNRYYTSKNMQCNNCNKNGHLSTNCPEPRVSSTQCTAACTAYTR